MKFRTAAMFAAASAALYLLGGAAWAAEPCDIPASLLAGGYDLKHVAEAVAKDKRLTVAVVGTGSSLLAGPDGPRSAYPARLEEALKHKLPAVDVKVVSLARSRMSAEDLARGMDKMLSVEKPDLVIWQTGTLDIKSEPRYPPTVRVLFAPLHVLRRCLRHGGSQRSLCPGFLDEDLTRLALLLDVELPLLHGDSLLLKTLCSV